MPAIVSLKGLVLPPMLPTVLPPRSSLCRTGRRAGRRAGRGAGRGGAALSTAAAVVVRQHGIQLRCAVGGSQKHFLLFPQLWLWSN